MLSGCWKHNILKRDSRGGGGGGTSKNWDNNIFQRVNEFSVATI